MFIVSAAAMVAVVIGFWRYWPREQYNPHKYRQDGWWK